MSSCVCWKDVVLVSVFTFSQSTFPRAQHYFGSITLGICFVDEAVALDLSTQICLCSLQLTWHDCVAPKPNAREYCRSHRAKTSQLPALTFSMHFSSELQRRHVHRCPKRFDAL